MGRGAAKKGERRAALRDITFEQYAGITAALADDLPLEAVLANEGLDAAAYKPIDTSWKVRLATSGSDGPLFKAYAKKRAEAEDWLWRPVTPIDEDLPAWLSFLHAWKAHPAPVEMLAASGLRLADMARLQRRWARRLEEDKALQKQAAELLERGPGPAPVITAGQVIHRPFPWSRVKAREPVQWAPSPAASPAAERLSPEPPPANDRPRPLELPSFMRAKRAGLPRVSLSPAASAPRPALPTGIEDTTEIEVIEQVPPVPFAGEATEEEAMARARQGGKDRPSSGERSLPEIGQTANVPEGLFQRIARGPLPFGRPAASGAEGPGRGPTGTLKLVLKEQDRGPRGTIKLVLKEQEPGPGGTARLPLKEPGAPQGARLTLEQHAELHAELTHDKGRIDAVFVLYGLTEPAWRVAEEHHWQERLGRSPEEKARWRERYEAHLRRLRAPR